MAMKNQRWLVDSGILRKKNVKEEPQELLVFGYSCKLFRDDERAKMIDQGKHLIPWMGDNTLKIDRYDGRGALGDLRVYEPPSGGFEQRTILTEEELKVEQLCDDERYRSLYNQDAESALYHEEEIKRLHQALSSESTYGQVGFNYNEDEDSQKTTCEDSQSPKQSEGSQEEDESFVPPPELEIPEGLLLPDTNKLNAIITKTALFISRQGGQMEILIKAKQANNPQFSFLSIDGALHPYYRLVLEAIKSGKYNPEKQPEKEESEPEDESDENDEPYLHPSLASSLTKVEAAPSIPSIQYKPSADCAYSMLVNKITGKPPPSKIPKLSEVNVHQVSPPPPPPPPPGYYPPIPQQQSYIAYPTAPQQYSHGPVIYGPNGQVQQSSSHQQQPHQPLQTPMPNSTQTDLVQTNETPVKEQSLAPLVPYGPTPPKPLSRPSFIVPPADVQIIIDKMASYVAKNGRDFEAIVKNKGDSRFNFLELSHQYHGYYAHKLTIYEGAINPKVLTEEELLKKQEPQEEKQKKLEELQKKQQRMEEVQKRVKMIQAKKKGDGIGNKEDNGSGKQITTVSFSIKKPKEGETNVIEKRNALPVEESDDDEEQDKETNVKSTSPHTLNNENNASLRVADDKELVDLTDDILEDCQKEIRNKQAEERMKEKSVVKDNRSVCSREKQLQLERKKKAAMFLSQIQPMIKTGSCLTGGTTGKKDDEDSDEVQSLPSPTSRVVYIDDSKCSTTNSLMMRLKGADLSGKRSRPRSRSRSGSRSHSDRQKQHKKHKKKKSSRRGSHDSPSSSRSHRPKKSKKSSWRHRSRSPSKTPSSHSRHRHNSRHRRKNSNSSDSGSSVS